MAEFDSAEFWLAVAQEIECGRALQEVAEQSGKASDWEAVLAFAPLWSVRENRDEGYSTLTMAPDELAKAVVEDVLMVEIHAARGAAATYPRAQLSRHLGTMAVRPLLRRVEGALDTAVRLGLLHWTADGEGLTIPAERLRDAMAFAGVFYDDPLSEHMDVLDTMLTVGGAPLVADMFSGWADEFAAQNEGDQVAKPRM